METGDSEVELICLKVTKQGETENRHDTQDITGEAEANLGEKENISTGQEVIPAARESISTGKEEVTGDGGATCGSSTTGGCHGDETSELEGSTSNQGGLSSDKPVVPLEIVKSSWEPETQVIEVSVNGDKGNKLNSVFHIVIDQPVTAASTKDSDSAVTAAIAQSQAECNVTEVSLTGAAAAAEAASKAAGHHPKATLVELREFPVNCPTWATKLKDCEEIGNSYRGFVENEVELDLLLTYHRQQTGTTWGTRQSPSTARESKRLMWKSNYVPYDGMPFLNLGSRAIVMECQYGPRRKGGPHKRNESPKKTAKGACTCPARIYVKKVRKFPDFQVDISAEVDRVTVKRNMDRVFQVMKKLGVDEIKGVERFYVQLPTNQAHQYHTTPEYQISKDPVTLDTTAKSRLHPELGEKIRELVANGEINAYIIRQILRNHVTRTMFLGASLPERHNLFYFPTINDIKNHVLLAISAIEKGQLEAVVPLTISDARAITEPPPSSLTSSHMPAFSNQLWDSAEEQDSGEIKPAASRHQMWPADSSRRPQTQSVTVTLTQNPDEGGSFISQVETQLSDGTTFISDSLTPETARLLSQINQHCQEVQGTAEDTLAMHEIVSAEQEEMNQSESLLEEPKSIAAGLNQSEEEIIDAEKNDPTLSQSDAMMGLTDDATSDDGNDQSDTLLQTEVDTAQSDSLLESTHTALSESEGLLHSATAVTAMDQSKHLLGSDPTAIDQSGTLLEDSDELDHSNAELDSSESMETEALLLRPAPELNDIEQDTPVTKRARLET